MIYSNFEEMLTYGGSFLVALCNAFGRADKNNLMKLGLAFPEVHRAYMHHITSNEANLEIPVEDPFADIARRS